MIRLSVKLYSRLMVLLPQRFGSRFRAAMVADFEAMVRDRGAWRAWARAIPDLAASVARQRFRTTRRAGASQRRRWVAASGWTRDFRLALRGLRRSPSYTALAMVTLTAGITANTAVFSLANWVLFRPVPGVESPEELVTVRFAPADFGGAFPLPHVLYRDMSENTETLADLGAYMKEEAHYQVPGRVTPSRIDGALVTENFFSLLGMSLAAGSTFDASPGVNQVVVSHRLWQRDFDGDSDAIGSTIRLNDRDFQIVGVAAEGFRGVELPGTEDLWVPIASYRSFLRRRADADLLNDISATLWSTFIGRVQPGVTNEAVTAELDRIVSEGVGSGTYFTNFDARIAPGLGVMEGIRDRSKGTIQLLMGLVAMVLLISIVNAASLTLARSIARRHQGLIQQALGGGRALLIRQHLVESLLVAVPCGLVSIPFSSYLLGWFSRAQINLGTGAFGMVDTDFRVVVFAVGASVVCGLVFGLFPALWSTRGDLEGGLRSRTHEGRRGALTRNVLVVSQLAISAVILVGTGLLWRTACRLDAIDTGLAADRVVTAAVDPGLQGYSGERLQGFLRSVIERVEAIPGVESAGLTWLRPFGLGRSERTIGLQGSDLSTDGRSAVNYQVSPRFFETLGIDITSGRPFTSDEFLRHADATGVIVINRLLARALFGESDPVGSIVASSWPRDATLEIVGVVEDVRLNRAAEVPEFQIFEPFGQTFLPSNAVLFARTELPLRSVVSPIREVVEQLDGTLPLYDVTVLREQVRSTIGEQLLVARLGLVFALTTLSLAAIGLYGVVSQTVVQTLREFGIRTALGASPGKIVSEIVRRFLRTVMLGTAVGLLAATQLSRLIESRMYGVERLDPATYGLTVALLVLATVAATLLPARRAARADPVDVLRTE